MYVYKKKEVEGNLQDELGTFQRIRMLTFQSVWSPTKDVTRTTMHNSYKDLACNSRMLTICLKSMN